MLLALTLLFLLLLWTLVRRSRYNVVNILLAGLCIVVQILLSTPVSHYLYVPILGLSVNMVAVFAIETELLILSHLVISFLINAFYASPKIIEIALTKSQQEITTDFLAAVDLNIKQMYLSAVIFVILWKLRSKKNAEINALKTELTTALAQLKKKSDELEKSLELKEIFITAFSHELKNALNGLLGNIHLIGKRITDKRTTQLLHSARACGEILRNFVDNLLDYSYCETGELRVVPENHSVAGFFQKTWNVIKEMIYNKRLEGYLKISRDIPAHLHFDRQKLFQIILNLTSNAVKFTEKGRVYIVVQWIEQPNCQYMQPKQQEVSMTPRRTETNETEARKTTEDESIEFTEELRERNRSHIQRLPRLNRPEWLKPFYKLDHEKTSWGAEESLSARESSQGVMKIMIVDNGCGIEKDAMDKIFEKRADSNSNPARRKQLGVGIGLWITKQLVHKLGGKVKAKSMPGLGSSFEVLLPTRGVKQSSIATPCSPSKAERAKFIDLQQQSLRSLDQVEINNYGLMPLQNQRIRVNCLSSTEGITIRDIVLIVDDDRFNVEFLIQCVRASGKRYLAAYDGEEALEVYKSNYDEICLVLSDNTMPKLSGVELARKIKDFSVQKNLFCPNLFIITADAKTIPQNSAGLDDGISKILTKPVEMDKIVNIVLKFSS